MIGQDAPDFCLPDQQGEEVTLSALRGQYVVLFFYPKDDTPGCTKEACGFRDLKVDFTHLGVSVFGISILDSASKAKFDTKHGLGFPLLADVDHAVAERYQVWKQRSMYGKTFMGVNRETFIIDPEGKIEMHWPKAQGSAAHPQAVLDWFKARLNT